MDPSGKSTRPGLSYTGVSHGRVPLEGLSTGWSNRIQACHTGMSLPSPSITLFGKGQF
ncbi:hypothetical protein F383_26943 [Gossypium arboreum]|uniref:Uncharacterized protein n=1 Tax=Gossypium arboreum TaxID=29729 RepID=A0A0B0PCY3_GOSAR|nr:hypothetical protein F383_26943 [Gossypium arboreum]